MNILNWLDLAVHLYWRVQVTSKAVIRGLANTWPVIFYKANGYRRLLRLAKSVMLYFKVIAMEATML